MGPRVGAAMSPPFTAAPSLLRPPDDPGAEGGAIEVEAARGGAAGETPDEEDEEEDACPLDGGGAIAGDMLQRCFVFVSLPQKDNNQQSFAQLVEERKKEGQN